jgi:UDP-N-acetylmuramoyl-tripeptide--D-alanyl-D-alanine ligase
MLLRLRQDDSTWHRVAVLELGMNHPGEIALLAPLAAPTVALVNNAQREHQEFMATVEAVARENGSVISALGAGGTVVVPSDDTYTPLWRGLAGARRVITFSSTAAADVTASAQWDAAALHWQLQLHTPAGTCATTLAQPGAHNLRNALAAAACALAGRAAGNWRRAWPLLAGGGRSPDAGAAPGGRRAVTLVDGSYNANPTRCWPPSTCWPAAGAALAGAGRHGRKSARKARPCRGRRARAAGRHRTGVDRGHAGRPCRWTQAFRQRGSVAGRAGRAAAGGVGAGQGSRFMKMERVVRALQDVQEAGHAA